MKKRLVFYAHNLEIGGIERALISLLKSIHTKYDITLILEENKGVLLNNIPNNITIKEYKISTNKIKLIRKIINRLKLIINIVINYNRYDFSCLYIPYSIPGSILMRYYSKNNSIWIHSDYSYIYKNIKPFFDDRNINKFKKIFMLSNEAKENFTKTYPNLTDKIIISGNLVEKNNIIKLSSAEKIKKGSKFIFINISRHEEESKKITRLIEASKKLSKEMDFELWLVGDGKDTENYKKLAKNLKFIKFLGLKENPYPYLKASNALVLSSNYEGFPVVYLEALTLNIPIVTTINISNSYFDIKDYALISEKDVDSLYLKMREMMTIKNKLKRLNIDDYNKYILKTFTKEVGE